MPRPAVADGGPVAFNPLFLYGGVGLGKTHLMHAIAWQVEQHDPERRVLYLSAEKFMYRFVSALRSKDTHGFKELFRSVDVLMVDDVQFICGKDIDAGGVLPHLQRAGRAEKQIVISADRRPSDLSRARGADPLAAGWGLVADLHPTDLRAAARHPAGQGRASRAVRRSRPRVMEFLAHRISSNVRELEGALNRLRRTCQPGRARDHLEMAQDCCTTCCARTTAR